MDLKQYISQALVDICEGVEDARVKVKVASGIAIAPSSIDGEVQEGASMVEFDVSIIVSDSTSKDGDGGVRIKVVAVEAQAGGKIENSTRSESQQRIRFAVPVHFQAHFIRK